MKLLLLLGALAGFAALGLAIKPNFSVGRRGAVLGFMALFALPIVVTGLNANSHLEGSKSTDFCLSCHEMNNYGKSLLIDDSDYLPAVHYQNHLVDQDNACFTCHTSYTMYGDVEAKIKGLKHVWVHYLGGASETIELYDPYSNRECLYCHQGARSFEEGEDHIDEAEALATGETSCLDCHDLIHDVEEIDDFDFWHEAAE